MILVDNAMWKWKKTTWCHMVSDTSLEELHEFAQRIGLARSWFQDRPRKSETQRRWMPHYDLTKSMRGKAIRYGAVPVDGMELVERAIWATSPPPEEDPADCPFCTQAMNSGPGMADHLARHHAGEFR